jgi:hypothetical protein
LIGVELPGTILFRLLSTNWLVFRQLPATSFFWQLAGNFSSQLPADIDLVFVKKLPATTPPHIT